MYFGRHIERSYSSLRCIQSTITHEIVVENISTSNPEVYTRIDAEIIPLNMPGTEIDKQISKKQNCYHWPPCG